MATPTKSGAKPVKPKAAAAAKKPASPAKPTVKPKAVAQPTMAKPATAKPVAAPKAKPVKTAAPAQPGAGAVRAVAADQRRYYVEVAAYYIAERRGFQGGNALEDWAAAEAEVGRLLREGVLNA